jgi:hypothetical protein
MLLSNTVQTPKSSKLFRSYMIEVTMKYYRYSSFTLNSMKIKNTLSISIHRNRKSNKNKNRLDFKSFFRHKKKCNKMTTLACHPHH